MQAGKRTRRNWSIALAASLLIHLMMLGCVRFAPLPSTNAADEATTVTILRITKRVSYAQGRRGGAAAAPSVSHTELEQRVTTMKIARGASAPGSKRAVTTAAARPAAGSAVQAHARPTASAEPGTGDAAAPAGATATGSPASTPGAEESPGPAPTITAEMLASLNRQMRDAIPSAAPQTIKHYTTDMSTLAVRPDPNRWTVANYPLPHNGLFAHAIIVRVGREAVAVRAIQRVGNAYICIGYLAKINEHNPDATLAGPYIGPCKKAWREQLGLALKPPSTPTSDPNSVPSAGPPPASNPPPSGNVRDRNRRR